MSESDNQTLVGVIGPGADGRHATGAEFVLDGVAVGQGGYKTRESVAHNASQLTRALFLAWWIRL